MSGGRNESSVNQFKQCKQFAVRCYLPLCWYFFGNEHWINFKDMRRWDLCTLLAKSQNYYIIRVFIYEKNRIEFTIFAKWFNWKSDYNSDQREIWNYPIVLSSLYFWTNVLDISFEYFRPKRILIKDLNFGKKKLSLSHALCANLDDFCESCKYWMASSRNCPVHQPLWWPLATWIWTVRQMKHT